MVNIIGLLDGGGDQTLLLGLGANKKEGENKPRDATNILCIDLLRSFIYLFLCLLNILYIDLLRSGT